MALEVMMPVITASDEEAVVTAWFVDEGAACTEGQLIAEVQAQKVSAEVEAPGDGYVVDRVAVNDPVLQGGPICRIVDSVHQPASGTTEDSPARESTSIPDRMTASPAAKRVAKELGIDLGTISGSGPEGRITEADVRGAVGLDSSGTPGLRAVIARNMRRSHAETAPVTLHTSVDLGEDKPTLVTATVIKAVAQTLEDHPLLNGHREGDRFIAAQSAQVAIAIQTDAGLVAPVLRNPASRTIEDIAADLSNLADRAAARTLSADDYEGGTFTVTNLGPYGIDGFTPIINLPQIAILGVGAIRRLPSIDEGGLVSGRYRAVLSLTFDHAFVDGAPAAAFLQQLVTALQA